MLLGFSSAPLAGRAGISVTGTDSSHWAADDWALAVAGFIIEDFEDTELAPHLRIGWETPAGSPAPGLTLPAGFAPAEDAFGTAFTRGVWDGARVLLNTADNQSHPYGEPQHWGAVVLQFTVPMRSVAFSLARVEGAAVHLVVNGANLGPLAEVGGLTPSHGRLGYLKLDATGADAIETVKLVSDDGEGFAVDHLAYAPSPRGLWTVWPPAQGGNGHGYRAVLAGSPGLDWAHARDSAASLGGHLGVITSAGENAFVAEHIVADPALWFRDGAGNGEGPWLGGFQPDHSPEPRGNWQWITGEPFEYGAWPGTEPNNYDGHEDRVCFFAPGHLTGSVWNDIKHTARLYGYVVEFDRPPGAPTITSPAAAAALAGAPFRYQITGTLTPRSFAALNLPDGLSVDAATGLITGTVAAAGGHVITLRAANPFGTGEAALTLTVLPAQRAEYDLAADWSDAENPHGAWALYRSETALFTTHQADWTGDGRLIPAWAAAPQPEPAHVPVWGRWTGADQEQLRRGEVWAHTAERDRTGTAVTKVRWTSPGAGVALIRGGVWMLAEQGRRVGWELRRNGLVISAGEVFAGDPCDHDHPFRFERGTGGADVLAPCVEAGDYLELALVSLSENGNLGERVGVDFRVTLLSAEALPGAPLPAGLAGWWPLDGDARDRAGEADGALGPGAQFIAGEAGGAIQFRDAPDSFVALPNAPVFAVPDQRLTLAAWVKVDYTSTGNRRLDTILAKRDGCGTLSYHFGINRGDSGGGGGIGQLYFGSSPFGSRASEIAVPDDGLFHHVAVVYDGNLVAQNIRFFIDGLPAGIADGPGPIPVTSAGPVMGKHAECGAHSTAAVDELMFFDRTLRDDEIAALYRNGKAGAGRAQAVPTILHEPADVTLLAGRNGGLSVRAAGALPLGYQWFFRNAPLTDATGATLELSRVTPDQAGPYFVVVTNLYGAATSRVATVTVQPDHVPPALTELLPAGALNRAWQRLQLTFSEPVDPASFTAADLAVQGPNGALDPAGFTIQPLDPGNDTRFEVLLPPQSAEGDYRITIGPAITDWAGNPMAAAFTATLTLDLTGPAVTALTPAGLVTGRVTGLQVTFDSPLDAASFTPADVTFSPPGPAVTAVQPLDDRVWRIALAGPLPQGDYTITLGPDLTDPLGNPMAAPFVGHLQVRLPDLAVRDLVAPAAALAGQPLNLTWTITNRGPAAAPAPWRTRLQLAATAQGDEAVPLDTFTVTNLLGAGDVLSQTGLVILPARIAGDRWLLVTADAADAVFEGVETNNTVAVPIALAAPNLAVGKLLTPANAQFGRTIPVTLAVTNVGGAPASAAWRDALYLSAGRDSLAGATLLGTFSAEPPPLAPGAGYARTVNVTLPLDARSAPGAFWLVAVADHGDQQPEGDETDNLLSAPLALSLPPLPDLKVPAVLAPGFALPGEPVELTWHVTNAGAAPATGRWSETVVLTTAAGGTLALGQFAFTNTLAPGDTLTRTQTVTLPLDGPAGAITWGVRVNSRGDVLEADPTNNLTFASRPTAVPEALSLLVTPAELLEGSPMQATATVIRNGDRAAALEVALRGDAPDEVDLPATVTLPAGAARATFRLWAPADHVVDGPQTVTVTAGAADYLAAAATVTVLDADRPQLRLTWATNVVLEGARLPVVVLCEPAVSNAVTITLESSAPDQLLPPPTVVIAPGANATEFEVTAVDDSRIEPETLFTLRATADGFIAAEAGGTVRDDDLPTVTLTLSAPGVSEGAGAQAVLATVTRAPVTERPVEIELTSSDPTAARVPARVTIPANEAGATFAVAAVDDATADGPQTATLGGYVLASLTGERVGAINSATLTVTDDDGPALRVVLADGLLPEGRAEATTLSVSRNTATLEALTVRLTSSDPSEATVPPTVVLPPGGVSVSVPVTTLADGVSDGNQPVTFTATAPGYADGTATATVTDTDLPDLVVARLDAPERGETGSYVTATYRVVNQGLVTLTNHFLNRVFLSTDPVAGDDTLVGQFRYEGSLPPGQYFEQSLQVRLPQAVGEFWVIVRTDTEDAVPEVLENNNVAISAAPIRTDAAYRASVRAGITTAPAGAPVPLTGWATNRVGEGVAFQPVTIHLRHNGVTRRISAITDATGHYAVDWQPLPGEAGFYEVGADHPGAATTPMQDHFTLLGLQASVANVQRQVGGLETVSGEFQLRNLADVPLTGLTGRAVTTPDVTVTVDVPATLPASGTVTARYTIAAIEDEDALVTFNFHFATAEGAELTVPAAARIRSRRARLAVRPARLELGVVRGEQRLVELEVVNTGVLASSPLTLSLPAVPWLQLASTNPLPALEPGATNRFTLQLLPPPDLPLGEYTGNLGVSGDGLFVSVPFRFKVVSAAFGDVKITVVDETTYYGENRAPLAGATVVLRDPFDQGEVARGETGPDGEARFPDLREGTYNLEVTAPKHDRSTAVVEVRPGETAERLVFLRTQLVRYRWTVEEIEIEDRTEVTLETTFETFVPTPVVTVTPNVIDLADVVGDEAQVDLVIENHGLIAANDVKLFFGTHPNWKLTPLVSDLGVLPARSKLTVPLLIQRISGPRRALKKDEPQPSPSAPCTISAHLEWRLVCGPFNVMYPVPIVVTSASGDCGGHSTGIYTPPMHGDPTTTGGGTVESSSSRRTVTIHPTPPGYSPEHNCACDPEHFSESCFSGEAGFKLDLLTQIKYAINMTLMPYAMSVDEISLKFSGNGQLCTCCENNVQGLKAQWEFGASVEGVVILGFSPNFETFFEVPEIGEVQARAQFIAGIVFNLFGSLQVNGETECFFEDPSYCISGTIGFGASPQISGTVTLTATGPDGDEYGGEGQAIVAVEASCSLNIEACNNAPPKIYGKLSDGVFTAGITGEITKGDGFVSVGYTYTKTLWEEQCIPASACPNAVLATGGASQPVAPASTATPELPPLTAARPVFVNLALSGPRAAGSARHHVHYRSAPPVPAGPAARGLAASSVAGERGLMSDDGVCAQVRLRLEQDAVMTRKAVGATLEIFNDSDTLPIEQLSVALSIHDADGRPATDRFVILPPELTDIQSDGTVFVTDTNSITLERELWRMAPGATGRARWVILPRDDAAPEEPQTYYVGGVMSYTAGGIPTAVPLMPGPVRVYPNARLRLHYFHERDVFSDDPFTDPVEPSVPFNLAVLVQNLGRGVARNFHLTSAQPKIVDNEKGLLIDFQIIATEVAGRNLTPSLTADFGDIGPDETVVARWLMTSTLQGLFVDYRASFEHDDALGGRETSLIDDVSIHEMIHLVQAGGAFEDGLPDFLVNDVADPDDRPDTLWLSDGTTRPVRVVEQAAPERAPDPDHLRIRLTAPLPEGWACLRVPEPSDGQLRLTRVTRADGREIPLRTNVWTTDRTFIGVGRKPVRENILHLLDYDSPGSYTLEYAVPAAPDTTPPTSLVEALPAASRTVFPVRWSGNDDSGEVAGYDVWVSVNGAPFTPWLQRTRLTTALFQGRPGERYAFYSVAVDAAGNREAPPATPDAATTASVANHPPVITPPDAPQVDEGRTFVLTPTVTDPDLPDDRLAFRLLDAPAGLTLDPVTGRMRWATGESHGPGDYPVTWVVSDNGAPPLSATNTFTLTVREVNTAPTLAALPDQIIPEGHPLVLTNTAWDADLPANTLRFRLGPNAPRGATVDADSGVFHWRPTEFQGPGTNLIQVIVTDDGAPPLSATQQFTVVVQDVLSDFTLAAGATNLLAGEAGAVPLWLNSGIALTNLSFRLEADTTRLADFALRELPPEVRTFLLQPTGSNRFDLHFAMNPDLMSAGLRPLARLDFTARPDATSALIPLRLTDILGLKRDGGAITNALGRNGRVILVQRAPVLLGAETPDPAITLYGRPGTNYVLEVASRIAGGVWRPVGEVRLAGRAFTVTDLSGHGASAFFRVREGRLPGQALRGFTPNAGAPAPLAIRPAAGPGFTLILPAGDGPYELLTTTNLAPGSLWRPAGTLVATNGVHVLHWPRTGEPARFFRVRPLAPQR